MSNRFATTLERMAREAALQRSLPPREAHASICSPIQHLPYPTQVALKEAALSQMLGKQVSVLPAGVIWGYRKKMEFALVEEGGEVYLAWYARGSRGRRKVPIAGCVLASERLNRVAWAAARLVQEAGGSAAAVKGLVVSESKEEGVCAVRIVVHTPAAAWMARWQAKVQAIAEVAAAQVVWSRPESPALTAERHIAGPDAVWLTERVCGISVRYPAFGFFQNHPWQFTASLIFLAEWMARVVPAGVQRELWDLYGGAGPIGLSLARLVPSRVARLRIVEEDAALVAAARENLTAAGIAGEVAQVSVGEGTFAWFTPAGDDIVVVDPPRAGLHHRMVRVLRERGPQVVAYLSCNPDALSRDLSALADRYVPVAVQGFDFAPHTLHLETLALLMRSSCPHRFCRGSVHVLR